MTTLVLLRHGTAGTRKDWAGDDAARPLDDRGRRQATAVPPWLEEAGVAVGSLLSSPMTRCVDTLVPVADALAIPIATDARLAEIEVPASSDDGWPNAAWLGARAMAAVDEHVDRMDRVGGDHRGGRDGRDGCGDSDDGDGPDGRADRSAGSLVVCSHGEILTALLAALAGRFAVGLPEDLDLTRKTMPKGGAWVCQLLTEPTAASELAVTELRPPC